jgi:hypothetical protein
VPRLDIHACPATLRRSDARRPHEALGVKPFDDQILVHRAGGFIGSVLRYRVSGFVQMLSKGGTFPFGTLAVNILGCFCN